METEPNSRQGCLIIVGSVLTAGVLTLAVVLLLLWRTTLEISDGSRRMAEAVAAAFHTALNVTPEVRVRNVVIVSADTPVLELVTLQRSALVRHTWSHTWLHSTKTFELEATFTARAGFDLSHRFAVDIDPETYSVVANFPPPRILSIEMSDLRILRDDDGLWNKLTAADREDAIRELQARARTQFEQSSFLGAARRAADEQFRALIDEARLKVRFIPNPPESH